MDVHDWFDGVRGRERMADALKDMREEKPDGVDSKSDWDIFLGLLRLIFDGECHMWAKRTALEAVLGLEQNADTLTRIREAAVELLEDDDQLLAVETRHGASWRGRFHEMTPAERKELDGDE